MKLQFKEFLHRMEDSEAFSTKETSAGILTIQQTERNALRKEGLAALKSDLESLYGDEFDIVETKEGIVVVAEGEDYTFSWEIKCTIKSLDYDPFIEANNFADLEAMKAQKKAVREAEAAEKLEKKKEKQRAKALETLRKLEAEE